MKRQLTIHFHRAVTDPKLETLEVVVTPLASANHPENDQTILGLKQVRKVTLVEPVTTVVFELIPTYQVGLDRPILYRIAWRRGSFGRIESREFSMPDQNVDYDDLFDLGHIISGENYLTNDDLGVPGRVAQLNDAGQVIDANGNIILSGDTTDLKIRLDNEIMQRKSADTELRSELINEFSDGIQALNRARENAVADEVSTLNQAISAEVKTRSDEDTSIRASISGVQTTLNTTANTLRDEFAAADAALASTKADLVGGKIPADQLPDIALGTTVVVADQDEMLQLTPAQVQPGDLAVRADGTFMLVLPVPGDPASWRRITAEAAVSSVNGKTGAITLSYDDVGARSATGKIPLDDVLSLSSELANKADTSALTNLSSTVNGERTKLTNLTTRVDGMAGAWQKAVSDAEAFAGNASASAAAAAQTAQNLDNIEQSVLTTKNDITQLQAAINTTASAVDDDAAQVRTDADYVEDMVAVQVTALALLNDQFGNMDQLVTSVNNVVPDESGNVSIFGGGTTLMLTEDPENPGLYHVTGQ